MIAASLPAIYQTFFLCLNSVALIIATRISIEESVRVLPESSSERHRNPRVDEASSDTERRTSLAARVPSHSSSLVQVCTDFSSGAPQKIAVFFGSSWLSRVLALTSDYHRTYNGAFHLSISFQTVSWSKSYAKPLFQHSPIRRRIILLSTKRNVDSVQDLEPALFIPA